MNLAAIQTLRSRLNKVPDFTSRIADLKQIQTNAAGRIDYFSTKMQDIELRKNAKVESSRVIEDAIVPGNPVRPNKPQNIMFAGLLGVFLGLCLALLQELLDDRINSPEEAERVLRLPNLGHVPLVEEEGLRLIRDISTFSPLMESYRSLRTNINFAAVGTTLRSIVVTSSVPAEGKSTTAANLAMAMQGLAVVPLFAGYDPDKQQGGSSATTSPVAATRRPRSTRSARVRCSPGVR